MRDLKSVVMEMVYQSVEFGWFMGQGWLLLCVVVDGWDGQWVMMGQLVFGPSYTWQICGVWIDFYSNFGKIGRSRRVFDEMPDRDVYAWTTIIGFNVDVYVGFALIDMYAKCGSLDRSLSVFFKLWEKNLFCWNSVIYGLAVHGYADEALKMFRGMEREKIKANGITFIRVLRACTHTGLVEEG
ncbi:pentatricopeptide repeat-containing protein [Quercus suber]|uniref:Pentatricopeptide repeat-containing protein n=1 Tax=Quercus suber TaxID=58331 RepID=A0AAW0KRA7_QUESU